MHVVTSIDMENLSLCSLTFTFWKKSAGSK